MKTLLITGTDTDIGKTVLTTSLAAYLQTYHRGKSLGLMKLLQTGIGDQETYHQLFSGNPGVEIVVPLRFQAPLAPPLAAQKEGRTIELDLVWQSLCSLQKRQGFVLVEALGGLGSPVTPELTVADIAGAWRLDTLLVVPVKLGAIAQSVANVALARQCKVKLKGIVLSCPQIVTQEQIGDWACVDLIQSLTRIPVLGIIPHLDKLDNIEKLTQAASNLDLEQIFYP